MERFVFRSVSQIGRALTHTKGRPAPAALPAPARPERTVPVTSGHAGGESRDRLQRSRSDTGDGDTDGLVPLGEWDTTQTRGEEPTRHRDATREPARRARMAGTTCGRNHVRQEPRTESFPIRNQSHVRWTEGLFQMLRFSASKALFSVECSRTQSGAAHGSHSNSQEPDSLLTSPKAGVTPRAGSSSCSCHSGLRAQQMSAVPSLSQETGDSGGRHGQASTDEPSLLPGTVCHSQGPWPASVAEGTRLPFSRAVASFRG